jgi:hypothetical protein
MKLDVAPLLSFSAMVLALSACGGKVVFSDGNGGAGGTGSTTKTTTATTKAVGTTSTPSSTTTLNSTVSTNVGPTTVNVSSNVTVGPVVGSSSTGVSTCDTGEIGNPQSNLCNDCVNCAISSTCATEFGTWNSDMDAQAFNACLNQCGNGPGCFNQCKNQHPAGAQVYQSLINCLLCSGCPANCNSPQQCPP